MRWYGERRNGKQTTRKQEKGSNLSALFLNLVENGLEGAVCVAAVQPGFFVVFIPFGQSFWPEIIGIPERLMAGLESVPAGHKDLEHCQFSVREK
jgi:hypothetical protein